MSGICLEHFAVRLLAAAVFLLTALPSYAQTPLTGPAAKDETEYQAVHQISEGSMHYLHGKAELRTATMLISADDMDYDEDTGWVNARGHVTLEHFITKDHLTADRATYNIRTHTGHFFNVSGTSPAKSVSSLGVLTTTNPFYFEAESADRLNDRYVLHNGYMTDCKPQDAWWSFESPKFVIIPDDHAIGHNAIFRLKGLPIFYLPYFYRPLGKNPRSSGFLTPQIGHSSLFGYLYGVGYYWAINPSYDMTIRGVDYTARGPALLYDFRGKPNDVTDFDFELYGVDDMGYKPLPTSATVKEGGLDYQLRATTQLWGFDGQVDYSYLSSLVFREVFSYSFTNAIYNEVNSVGFLQRRYDQDAYTLTFSAERNQTFEALTPLTQPAIQVLLDKLPGAEFNGREQQVVPGPLPVWFSFSSSADLLSRTDPTGLESAAAQVLTPQKTPVPLQQFSTGPYGRLDVEPRVMTNFQFGGFSVTPAVNLGVTDYTNSYSVNTTTYNSVPATTCTQTAINDCPTVVQALANSNLLRKDVNFSLEFRTPQLERIYTPPKWLHLGTKLKHVIEAGATYDYMTGVDDFQHIIRYDDSDLLADTNQVTFRLINRIYRKEKNGNASEIFSWELDQARYFDPTFGGAVLSGTPGVGYHNVVFWSTDLTPIPFLDGPRNYSPIVSNMQLNPFPFLSIDWRTDYDPLRHSFVDQTYNANLRRKKFFAGVGQTAITTYPVLVPQANQINFGGGYGSSTRKGWNFNGSIVRDLLRQLDFYETAQAVYNTDCCGFGFRYQRINFGARQGENQYLFSFSLANIGTFGSMQRAQSRF